MNLKRVRKDVFCVAVAGLSSSGGMMLDVLDAECVERVQLLCSWRVNSQVSFRVAVSGLRMPRLIFFVADALLL